MEIRVLGRVRLVSDGKEVGLGPQPAITLAALLLSKGRLVTATRLTSLLWPEERSDSRKRQETLRSHVSHLRRDLRDADADPQTTIVGDGVADARGYRLTTAAGQIVDAEEFETFVVRARSSLERGDIEQTRRCALAALSRWQDEPYAGLHHVPLLADEARRLTELWHEATDLRVEAELADGRHEELVPELTDLTRQFPERIPLRRALMLALYRSGRRSDALSIYDRAKAELQRLGYGFEPLEALRRQILAQTDELAWRPLRQLPRGPLQLPPDQRGFVGRAAELQALVALIEADPAGTAPLVVSVFGRPGIGKTALVNHVANAVQHRFDVILSAQLDKYGPSPVSSLQELASFLRLIDVKDADIPHTTRAASAMLRNLLVSRRSLIVVDDAARADDVQPFIPSGGQHVVLVTSRSDLADLDGVQPIRLDVLATEDCIALLATFVDRYRLDAEPAALDRLIQYCGGMPLALRLVGALLRDRLDWTLAQFYDWLDDDPMARMRVGERDLVAPIRRSYEALPAEAAELLQLLGALHLYDVSVELAAAVTGRSVEQAATALGQLRAAQLIDSLAPPRYQLHHVVLLFAQLAHRESAAPFDAPLARALDFYLSRLSAADALLNGETEASTGPNWFTSIEAASAWFAVELRNLTALARRPDLATTDEGATFLVRLNQLARRYFDARSLWDEWEVTAAASGAGASHLGLHSEAAQAIRDRGIIAARRGLYDQAETLLSEAGGLYATAGDAPGEAAVLNNLGLIHLLSDHVIKAVPLLVRARELFIAIGASVHVRTTTMNLGEAHRRLGDGEQALALLTEALEMSGLSADGIDDGKILHNLAEVHRELGNLDQARDFYLQSLLVFDRNGDDHTRALTLAGLGLVAELEGDLPLAQKNVTSALAILHRLGSADAVEVERHLDRLTGEGPAAGAQ